MEQQQLGNPTLLYVLSSVGAVMCCCLGSGGITAGIALYMADKNIKQYQENPEGYQGIEKIKTAKTVALVVLILNLLYLAYTIYSISTTGWDVMLEQSRELLEQYESNQP